MKRINGRNTPQTEEELRQWEQEWSDMMVSIWTENILRLGIKDTGHLMRSLTGRVAGTADHRELVHQFAEYGIYVARGTGRGYYHGNPGDLEFLNPVYRAENKLDKPRKTGPAWTDRIAGGKPRSKKCNWFLRKYLRSMYVLAETERNVYGEMFMGNFSNVLDAILSGGSDENNNSTLLDRNGRDMSYVLAKF